MALDLESLRGEIQSYLDASDIPVFFGYHRTIDALTQIAWDVESHPDFRDFIATGRKAGAKLIVFTHLAFSLDQIDEALEQLQAYEGFTCSVELSFTLDTQVYLFELHTDWYKSLNDILAELDIAAEVD